MYTIYTLLSLYVYTLVLICNSVHITKEMNGKDHLMFWFLDSKYCTHLHTNTYCTVGKF